LTKSDKSTFKIERQNLSQRCEVYIGSRQGVTNINNANTEKFAVVLETGRFFNSLDGCPRI